MRARLALVAVVGITLTATTGLDARSSGLAPARRAAATGPDAPPAPGETLRHARVRPQDPRLAELLRAGIVRSATFRSLVDRLEASDVIVYISLSHTLRTSLAGKLTWMTRAGGVRYLRATINAEQSADQMIATLAHELQHAIEVSADAGVTDQRSLMALYKRIGWSSHSGLAAAWETEAARDTGYRVRRELVSALGIRSEL